MKLSTIPSLVALGVAALCGYALYTFSPQTEVKIALSVIAGVVLFVSLLFTVGIQTPYDRTTMNLRFLSSVFFAGLLVLNTTFAFILKGLAASIIVNGIVLLLFLLIANSIIKAKQ
ncbi:MAG: hypothetical protein ACKO4K_06760 [Flavobacteriales bacterium]|jgi:hypothetical protein